MQLLLSDPRPDTCSCGALQSSEDVCTGHNAHQLCLAVYNRDAVHLRREVLSCPQDSTDEDTAEPSHASTAASLDQVYTGLMPRSHGGSRDLQSLAAFFAK